MIDVQQPQPALLPQRQADRAPQFYEFLLVEVLVLPIPEGVVRVESPDDGFCIGECCFLAVVVLVGLLEVHEIIHLNFFDACILTLDGALIAAKFTDDRPRDVETAKLFYFVRKDAVAKNIIPGLGEKPKTGRHVGAYRTTLGTRIFVLCLSGSRYPAM